ncbi:MAG: TIGR03663 family protein [Planctomycetes bacterium]|nr:TIGR03663 family protein [Planctomycetota bacterium]
MMRGWHFVAAIILSAVIAAALRLPDLDRRPMHGDEAVHAYKLETLRETGTYQYDPYEYHGPTLYYSTLPVLWINGVRTFGDMTETMLRVVPVLFGVGMILLLPLFSGGVARRTLVAAAVLTAASPALTFYSRYYIQESLLAFFTLAVLGCGWRYVHTQRRRWSLATGVCAGLMHATKETCIISFACMLIALIGTLLWRRHCNRDAEPFGWRRRGCVLAVSVALGVTVSALLYSGFLTNMRGPWDSVASYAIYLDRAGGGIHQQPWYYYLKLLLLSRYPGGPAWSEAFIVIMAALGGAVALIGGGKIAGRPTAWSTRECHPLTPPHNHRSMVQFLAIYTLLMMVAYSIIPYKTPWSMVEFVQPMIVLAGIGAAVVMQNGNSLAASMRSRGRAIACRMATLALILAAAVHLGWQAHRASFRFAGDYRNPYVYAQPLRDVMRLGDWIERLSAVHPDGEAMLTKVIAENPWPLPWYLRRLERVGYWDAEPPTDVDAPVVIVSDTFRSRVEERMHNDYHLSHYGLRPDVVLLVYVDRALWEAFATQEGSNPGDAVGVGE